MEKSRVCNDWVNRCRGNVCLYTGVLEFNKLYHWPDGEQRTFLYVTQYADIQEAMANIAVAIHITS
jgi:hypothetical protein